MGTVKENGGARKGAGRKPKVEEQKLIEKLSPLQPHAYKALDNALKEEQGWAVKLFFEYMYGKPKQTIDQTTLHTLNDFKINDVLDFDKPKR